MSETTNLKLFIHDDPETNMDKFDIEKAVSQNWINIDDYAETVNEKLESLEKVDSTTNETITAIQEEQTTQNENIEKNAEGIAQNKKDVDEELTKIKEENSLLKSQIPTGTASGNNIHLEDSSNMDFEWKLRGGSWQATRSGKNVINVRTTTISTYSSVGDDDYITVVRENTSETASSFCNFFTKITKELKTDTNYTILCEIKSIEYTGTGYLSITNDSTSFAFSGSTATNSFSGLKAGNIIINKLKTKSDFTNVTNLLRTFVAVNAQSSVKIVYRLSVIEGDVTADSFEYEAYGVSPSLDFPSEIKNVGDDVKIVIRNKNFCDLDILENIKGKAITINNRNSFTINLGTGGMGITTGTNIMLPNNIDKNKKYRIKYHRTMNNTTFLPYIKVIYADGSMDGVNNINLDADYEYVTKGAEIASITLAWNTQSQGGIVTFSNISITEADEDNDFEESKKEEIIFPLAEGQKLYEGSYLGKDGIHNIRKQIKLLSSGGDFFVSDLGTYQVFGKTQKGVKKGSRLLSNYFKDYDSVGAIKYTPGIANNSTADRIYVSNGISTTLDEFKDWLNKCENTERPVILEYELAEEEIIPYTQEQQAVIDKILYTYKNVTNISVDNDLAILDITYKKDIETMFNNQAKEYNERLSNIENLLNTTETSALLLDNLENDLEKEV